MRFEINPIPDEKPEEKKEEKKPEAGQPPGSGFLRSFLLGFIIGLVVGEGGHLLGAGWIKFIYLLFNDPPGPC